MIGVSIAWIPVIKEIQGGQIFIYIQEITDYLAPPFAAVFLLAVLVPRVNEKVLFINIIFCMVHNVYDHSTATPPTYNGIAGTAYLLDITILIRLSRSSNKTKGTKPRPDSTCIYFKHIRINK